MRADAFVDTDILLYAISTAPQEAAKKQQARAILAEPGWGLPVQVLQEFYVNATRPPRPCAWAHPCCTRKICRTARHSRGYG